MNGYVNGNGTPDECETTGVPTASAWGLAVMVLLMVAAGSVVIRRQRCPTLHNVFVERIIKRAGSTRNLS